MYKALIIDDEEPLREAIRILGEWESLGVDTVLEAADGESGLNLLKQQPVDLVMVDMKMPGLSGPEVLQILERDYPGLPTIVISGYNDFEFTRQAIKSRVVDYLLKPVNRTELNQAMRKAVGQLADRRQHERENISRGIKLNMSLPKLKEKFYQSLLDRSFHPAGQQDLLSLIGAPEADGWYGAAVLRLLNMGAVARERFNSDLGLLHFAVSNIVNDASGPDLHSFCFANPRQYREMVTILTMRGGSEAEMAFHSKFLLRKIQTALRDLLGLSVVFGFGEPCQAMSGLADAYEEARSALLQLNLQQPAGSEGPGRRPEEGGIRLPAAPLQPSQLPPSQSAEMPSIMHRMPLLRSALETGSKNQARTVLADYLRSVGELEGLRLGDADRALQDFKMLLRDAALSLGLPDHQLPSLDEEKPFAAAYSLDYTSFKEYEEVMHRILEEYCDLIRTQTAAQGKFDAEDIKTYIDTHYFEDFKISLFTEKYFLSREYLMKRFKQQFGCGIHEYAQKVRMEKAKELLADPALKIQEISEMLGYRDKNYFSKAFRNYCEMSPTEYRLSITGEKA
ncbi:response regulator [Paenibacillus pinistramenti]|uniref:response regulator n=1 Tax=Paenibacillus pinistramenti TaxID=1768003 RepID=UPI00110844D6|nr:response regulator [Paenibacillus pinistramenti]